MTHTAIFSGLSAFPLTPVTSAGVDESSFAGLVERLADAGVDSIGALGSTGSYAYLSAAERARVAEVSVRHAGPTPVIVGIGSVWTRDVLEHLRSAEGAGAAGVLLAPVSYQPLTDDEVFGLFEDVAAVAAVPVVVYDNPTTTGVVIGDDLHARLASLGRVVSIKIPPVAGEVDAVRERVASLRAVLPDGVSVGISGDAFAARGLLAGCELWYSGLAGVLPERCLGVSRAALAGDADLALALSAELEPFWALIGRHGSLRVASAVAAQLGLVPSVNLPRPVRELDAVGQRAVADALRSIGFWATR